jgi:hypothetical protein
MSYRRVIMLSLLTMIWFSGVLHCDLEAIGLMLEHEHGHVHVGGTEADHPPLSDGEHESVCNWDLAQDGRIALSALWALIFIPLIGLLTWTDFRLRLRVAECRFILERCKNLFPKSWQFVWRCALESTAPPVLS